MGEDNKKIDKHPFVEIPQIDQALVQVVIHDLQVGLQALLTDAEMLNRNLSNPKPKLDRIRKDARDILSRIDLLIATTDNLRATRLDNELSLFDLDITIRHAIKTIASVAAERNLSIEYHNEINGVAQIIGSKRLVSLILYNLLTNAIKYSYHRRVGSSPILIHLKEHGSNMAIEIQNRGIPIAEDEKNQILEKGYRGSTSAKMRAPGSGLGLYVAKTIVEKYNGSLEIASKLLKGDEAVVTVTIIFPRANYEKQK